MTSRQNVVTHAAVEYDGFRRTHVCRESEPLPRLMLTQASPHLQSDINKTNKELKWRVKIRQSRDGGAEHLKEAELA